MCVAVTGANGLLGTAVVAEATRAGHTVLALTRSDTNYHNLNELTTKLQNVDVLVHTAGVILSRSEQQKRPAETLADNILLDIAVATAARAANVKKTFLCSSILAYGSASGNLLEADIYQAGLAPATLYYGHAKRTACLLADALQKQYSQDITALVFPNIYGPGDKFDHHPPPLVPNTLLQLAEAFKKSVSEVHGGDNGHIELELLYSQDAAKTIVALLDKPDLPSILNVPAETHHTIADVYDAAATAVGFTGTITWDQPVVKEIPKRQLDGSLLDAHIMREKPTSLIKGVTTVWQQYVKENAV
jgi:nucleoside-diphosphate-sugar epimerase